MNDDGEHAMARRHADDVLDLGTRFRLDLDDLSNNETRYTTEQCIAALEASTTLTSLEVCHSRYTSTPENMRRVIEPLCRCISSLRLHNAQHPLRQLTLQGMGMDEMDMDEIETMEGVVAQFLDAAKQFGIFHIKLSLVDCFPIQFLVEFCRDNKSLTDLELDYVSFSGGTAGLPLPLNNGLPKNSDILSLDKLALSGISFGKSTAATAFAALVAQVNVSSLFLSYVTTRNNDEEEEDDNDTQITERILSELKIPSAEHLTLYGYCHTEHFKAALDAGTTTVTDLDVDINCDEVDKTAELELLASFIRCAVKLNTLRIAFLDSNEPHISLPPLLFQAMEACATVTQIRVILKDRYGYDIVPDVGPEVVQQLQKITAGNRELDRFATNPGSYPTDELLNLMRQFDNCPSGLYMLACHLPGVFSFDELRARILRQKRNAERANRDTDKDVGAIPLKKVKHSNQGPAL